MDARSNEPGLDIPQTRQRLAPGLTSAPQLLQAKAKEVIPVRAVDPRQNTPSSSLFHRARPAYIRPNATDQHDRSASCGSSIVFFAKGFVRLEWALTQSITSRSEVNFPK
jgi:hypothetical protein